jgi:AcrR family transcriptional regulator
MHVVSKDVSRASASPAGLPASAKPKRLRNRSVREKALLAAGRKLFATRGYEATTTREIAAEAGCAEGLIHRYFQGKAGLLLALIRSHIGEEVADLTEGLRRASGFQEEVLQLLDFELGRMWSEREFLKVVIPRAIVEPDLGAVVREAVTTRRAEVVAGRLARFRECQGMSRPELEALAQYIGIIGFMFGFMRPAVLGEDREHAREVALILTRMLLRSIPQEVSHLSFAQD